MTNSVDDSVGIVRELWRYPVKSMAGESLTEAKLGWNGFAGDRRYGFHKKENQSGLPFASARETPQLTLYRPAFADPVNTDRGAITIETPDGAFLDLYHEALRSELESQHGGKLEVISLWRGLFDSMPVSLVTTTSLSSISSVIGRDLESSRFRPNIVIETTAQRPYPEDKWVGELLVFGDDPQSPRVRVNRKDLRCGIVDLNPRTAIKDCDLLSDLVKVRRNFLGVYGSTERTGHIRVNDRVYMPAHSR